MKSIILLLCFFSLKSYSQDTITILKDTSLRDLNSFKMFNFKDERILLVNNLLDSLNKFEQGKIPFFVSNYDFDYQNQSLWKSVHEPISLRKMIFDSVKNKMVLLAIIKSKNKNYRIKSEKLFGIYGRPDKIVYQNKSNWDLASERLKVLAKK